MYDVFNNMSQNRLRERDLTVKGEILRSYRSHCENVLCLIPGLQPWRLRPLSLFFFLKTSNKSQTAE